MPFHTHLIPLVNSQRPLLLNDAVSLHGLFFKTEISFLQSKLNICLFITVWIVILDVDGGKKTTDVNRRVLCYYFAKVASNVIREKEKIHIYESYH